ncbi:hypothetical protein F8S13_24815 [Chloroflexia bacterium SDU3-3]|nr:hypothetical protein F8S13_24815 [Chloroflexia bacterium SDU3-3]
MSSSTTRFGRLPWIGKVAIGIVALLIVSAIAWVLLPRQAQNTTQGPPPDPALTAAHQKIIDSIVIPIERTTQTTPVPPKVRTINSNNTITTFLSVPLVRSANTSSAQFIEEAKQQLATVINTMFAADSNIQILVLTGTYPVSDGREAVVVSVFMEKSAWQEQGKITSTNIEKVAQSFQISNAFKP